MRALTTALAAAVLLAACSTLSVPHDIPALVSSPTEKSRTELRQAVSRALNGIKITVADDALTKTSLLTIERSPIRDVQGRRIMGREPGKPHQFRLVKNGSDCVLVKSRDNSRWVLAEATCIAEQ